ncbi:uncharacterized protein TNCV_3344261 [Trichonephila clavipes]|nr:uncharacterized protein TNCV_3344261 [Trichonephila clavipes]
MPLIEDLSRYGIEDCSYSPEAQKSNAYSTQLQCEQFCLIYRPKQELLGLLPFNGQTRGEYMAIAVIECMDKHSIPLDKSVSISTDGAKKALCRQTFPDEICKVMELVITIINSILAKALNHRQLKEFLFEMESEYADLLLHNKYVKNSLNATITELKFSPFEIDIGSFEIQLLDLKNKEIRRSKFERLCVELEILEKKKCDLSSQHKWSALNNLEKEDMIIFNAWNSIPDSYDQLKKLAFAVLSLFGSTYTICDQSFSSMDIIKSKLRSRLIDENLESCLILKTTYKPDLLKLSEEMQAHCSY